MSHSALVLGVVAAVLLAAGCGSQNKSSRSTSSTAATTSTAAVPNPPSTTSPIPANNGSATAILPANFVVAADGSLSPTLIAGPAHTTIVMTVTSRAAHPIMVSVASDELTVPARALASIHIAGLRKGRYKITVDGKAAGALVIGAQPGP